MAPALTLRDRLDCANFLLHIDECGAWLTIKNQDS